MREIRSSGSVEGIMGDHDSYSDSTPTASKKTFVCHSLRISVKPAFHKG
jgi:hypothetical protein